MVNKSIKKAQSLPLNTIVIAILVIIVLLVIVVFFTTKVGESGKTLNEQSATKCSATNAAITTLGYKNPIEIQYNENSQCGAYEKIPGIPIREDENGNQYICCNDPNGPNK